MAEEETNEEESPEEEQAASDADDPSGADEVASEETSDESETSDASEAADGGEPEEEVHVGHEAPGFVRRYIFSTDHKVIGIQFAIVGLLFMLVGGLLAMAIRWQLAWPGTEVPLLGGLKGEDYNKLITMHGTIMVFFAVTPLLIGGFGNYLIPLQIGARDMAFPVLNMLSFWVFVPACALVLVATFMPGDVAPNAGWTSYPPLSGPSGSPGLGQTLWILSLTLAGVSTIMGSVNYITTVLRCRARKMGLFQIPLPTWGLFFTAVLNALFIPVVAAALILLLLDRLAGTTFFMNSALDPTSGDPLLYQHIFWMFGHPEVYILILPAWGIVSELLAVFSRKPAFGYRATVLSMATITALSMIVWGHHMYTSGMNPIMSKAFMTLTMLISIPSSIFFLNWLGTVWKGAIQFTSAMLFTLSVVVVFALGGLTGLFAATHTVELYIHDTYFIVAHFHFTLAASVLFGGIAAVYYWFPKMFGRMLNETLGKLHWFFSLVPLMLAFFGMFYVGGAGMMRRIADPTVYEFLEPVQWANTFVTWTVFVLGAGQLIFVFNFFWSLVAGEKAPANPWNACSLEWSVSSPPPLHNWPEERPLVTRWPYEYSPEGADKDWISQAEPVATVGGAEL